MDQQVIRRDSFPGALLSLTQIVTELSWHSRAGFGRNGVKPSFLTETAYSLYPDQWVQANLRQAGPTFPSNESEEHRMPKQVLLEDARRVIAAAEKKAHEIGQPMNIAVADAGGNLVAHVRMDGAWIGSIDISIKKAFTSRAFDIATKDLAAHSQSGNQFFGIHASNDGKIMIFAGGIPLKSEGKVVGAIGVSGGSGEQDHAVAEAGAAAF